MSITFKLRCPLARLSSLVLLSGLVVLAIGSTAWAGGIFRQTSVGGISINALGVVSEPNLKDQKLLQEFLLKEMQGVPGDLNQAVELRKISLRGLEEAIAEAFKSNSGVLPDEIKYLAGIQRIEYILVYPEQNDIVLAGPGEGWKVDETASVVGVTTGLPVIQLDDLLVALRSVQAAREVGITCSIDPRPEGVRAFRAYMKKHRRLSPALIKGIEKSMGPQDVTFTGIPTDSHFARVLVASDYRMKRIAMRLEKSPVRGLPSFLDLLQTSRARVTKSMMPRWWLACNYEPLARSEDGLAWQLRGQGVKAMTEVDFITAAGEAKRTDRKNPIAQKWADLMTARFEDLSIQDSVFGELRNLMDLCVVAALIEKEGLREKAGCRLPMLYNPDSSLMLDSWNTPKTIATQSSFIRKGNGWLITASGGVEIDSWQVASKTEKSESVKQIHRKATAPAEHKWWWN